MLTGLLIAIGCAMLLAFLLALALARAGDDSRTQGSSERAPADRSATPGDRPREYADVP